MTRAAHILCGTVAVALLALAGCDRAPGQPGPGPEVIAPSEVTDFEALFGQNCAGCHGENGGGGAALALNDPVYLAIVDDATLRRVSSSGIRGTAMSAFARSSGGMLTDQQIDIIVFGIRSRWAKPNALQGAAAPPYASTAPGNAQHGAEVFTTYCASCHGPAGRGTSKASSIVDGSFLALLPDQELRTLVIVGRPELHAPDWRNNVAGHPMSPQEISDVVAWLSAQRPAFPGQPYPGAEKKAGETQ